MRVASERHNWHCSPPQPWQVFSMQVFTDSSQTHCRPSAPYTPSQGFLGGSGCVALQVFLASSRHSWHCSPPQPWQVFSMQVFTSSYQAQRRPSAPYTPSQGLVGTSGCVGSVVLQVVVLASSRHSWHCSPPQPLQALSMQSSTQVEMVLASSRHNWHCSPPQPLHCCSMQSFTVAAAPTSSRRKTRAMAMVEAVPAGHKWN
mmetsp:Transcript_101610/g.124388  ORF Transcript_101610/g.124388 Transcript_101610/m.124388 type:complete len:202 (-) Transcript_101610:20-625(-)